MCSLATWSNSWQPQHWHLLPRYVTGCLCISKILNRKLTFNVVTVHHWHVQNIIGSTVTVIKSYDNRLEAFNSRSVNFLLIRSHYQGSECAEFYLQSPYTPSWYGHIKRKNHTLQLIRKLVACLPCYVCVEVGISGADCTEHKRTKTKRMACSDVHDVHLKKKKLSANQEPRFILEAPPSQVFSFKVIGEWVYLVGVDRDWPFKAYL